ncbi:polyketide cyclase / dehydrase family protein [Mycobacterium sp. JS623]|uniref:SRPBCC family protein n=1 Tax=Mycobacterium sp. JS623 TaxID=212767 RepID=UPI0002A596DF|nr:SRPBCC family protein [Mycobacterium sp. JS623]AGB25752.1 polyketide cyclase / dehydrase family protein [Mycobacterium sp. JS623]
MAKTSSNGASNHGGTATDTLRGAGQDLLGVVLQRAASSASERINGFADRLTDVSETGEGLTSLVRRPRSHDDDDDDDDDDGKNGGGGGLLGGLKDKVKDMFGGGGKGGGGGGKKLKLTNIVETLDVGVPLRTTYDLWTQYTDFPSFMKKLEAVDQSSDEETHWKAQVLWSHREWDATTVEQVPDSHIIWTSRGSKGHVDGAVTFTALGPNLTRVTLVIEYFPQGLFERTGNLWRAQGRRMRLEFKHFRRHAMTQALLHPEEIEGWRGEIRDSEVVKTHEEALEEEQESGGGVDDEGYAEASDEDESNEDVGDDDYDDYDDTDDVDEGEDLADDEDEAEYDEPEDEDVYEDEPDEDLADEDLADDDAGVEEDYDEAYDDEDYEDEGEPRPRRRSRHPVGASGGGGGARS